MLKGLFDYTVAMKGKTVAATIACVALALTTARLSYGSWTIYLRGSSTSCLLDPKEGAFCQQLLEHCDQWYFYIAECYYCKHFFPPLGRLILLSSLVLVSLVILVVTLSLLASNYLLPNLKNLTRVLKVNHQILSFILIPLSNSVPDLVTYHINIKANAVDLVLGQVTGSVLISFTLIIGLISILKPFSISDHRLTLLNLFWVLVALNLFSYILSDGKITIWETVAMTASFSIYVTYSVWYDQKLITEISKEGVNIEEVVSQTSVDVDETISLLSGDLHDHPHIGPHGSVDEEVLAEEQGGDKVTFSHIRGLFKGIDIILCFFIPVWYEEEDSSHFNDFKITIHGSKIYRIWITIETTCFILYNVLSFILSDYIPIVLVTLLVVEVLGLYLSKTIKEVGVNIVGMVNSFLLISMISVEMLNLLKNLGLMWRISDYVLGLSVFSIVNSISDITVNLALAVDINPILGLNACLGTSILLILAGIGINGLYFILGHGHSLKFDLNRCLVHSTGGLLIIVSFYLIYIPLNNWKFDKKLGIFGICWWIFLNGLILLDNSK